MLNTVYYSVTIFRCFVLYDVYTPFFPVFTAFHALFYAYYDVDYVSLIATVQNVVP